jgi:hypothetical protein
MARPRLSAATRAFRGTARPAREAMYKAGGKAAPKARKGQTSALEALPAPPKGLSAAERKAWEELAQQLPQGIPPTRRTAFRLLVAAMARLEGASPGVFGQRLGQLERQLRAFGLSGARAAPVAAPTPAQLAPGGQLPPAEAPEHNHGDLSRFGEFVENGNVGVFRPLKP